MKLNADFSEFKQSLNAKMNVTQKVQIVHPVTASEDMTQPVGVDENGKLFTIPTTNGTDGKSAYAYAKDGGYTGTEEEFAKKLASGEGENYVTAYGAKGDGVTDDTAAFKAALAAERIVLVSGGTYVLSDTLTIGANCQLELSQDTVMQFTQTSGNCVELRSSATLRGNHGIVYVPYAFAGKAIAFDADYDTETNTPPYTHWDPMWKSGRYVYDVCIVKAHSSGLHYSYDGTCSGTALYMHTDSTKSLKYMYGVTATGVRIAGAFNYGINAVNDGTAWNHDMRIEAVIDGCEIGVALDNCNCAHLAVTVQPKKAVDNTRYAKHGISIKNSLNVDLIGSRVWDWHSDDPKKLITLWTNGGEYQHIALYGNCGNLVLDDFLYGDSTYDIRDLIYTDTASNLERMTILQEPITRWFKSVDGVPYFSDGLNGKKLITEEELANHFDTDVVKKFTDVLQTAVGSDGSVYYDIGYKVGVYPGMDGSETSSAYHVLTGFIPCKAGDVIYAHDMSFAVGNDFCRVQFYDSNFNICTYNSQPMNMNRTVIINNSNTYLASYEATDNGFKLTVNGAQYHPHGSTAYVRFSIYKTQFGEHPMVSVNEEIKYTVEGFLARNIKVRSDQVIGNVEEVQPDDIGGSIDVTAEVGQTIVVEEVDANGKPTKWRAADYQPRTHWSEFVPTVLIDNQTIGEYYEAMFEFMLVVGQSYHIVFNGVEYDEVARTVEIQGATMVAIGNDMFFGGEDTGEPYVIISVEGVGSNPSSVYGGDYTLTLSTVQEVIYKLPEKYIPDEVATYAPYYLTVIEADDGEGGKIYSPMITVERLEAIIDSGRQVIVKTTYELASATLYMQLNADLIVDGVRHIHFSNTIFNLVLVPLDDGLYEGIFTTNE